MKIQNPHVDTHIEPEHIEPEHGESFMDLLMSGPHWLFEITTSVVEALVVLLVGAIVWPKFRAIGESLHKRFDKDHGISHDKVDLDLLDAVWNGKPRVKVGPNPFTMHVTEQPVGECMDCGLEGGHIVGCSSVNLAVVLDTSQPAKVRQPKVSDLEISSSEHLRLTTNVFTKVTSIERMTLVERMADRDVYHRQMVGAAYYEDDLAQAIALHTF